MALIKITSAAAVVALLAVPAVAQSTVTGVKGLNDRIDEIERDVAKDMAKSNDAERFGPNNVPQGMRGSMSLSTSTVTGNSSERNLSLAGRLSYGVNSWNHSIGFAKEYARSNGNTTKDKSFATYEVNKYFSDQFYMFGTARYQNDKFAANRTDAFLGFGPGYRVINNENVTWRVQVGPGARYTRDQAGVTATKTSALLSSRFFYKLNETVSVTDDIDVLYSKDSTVSTHDIGLNFKMSDALSTRVGYRTDYNSAPLAGYKKTDNTLSVSLVLGF